MNVLFRASCTSPHPVKGSPCGTNRVTTELFVTSGRVFPGNVATPLVVDAATYNRDTAGRVNVFATEPTTAEVTFSGGAVGAAGEQPATGDDAGRFFGSAALGTVPGTVNVTATKVAQANNDAITRTVDVNDVVTILQADYDNFAKTLTIVATYTPNLGFSGQDSFTYTATDGQAGSNTATVTVDVFNVHNPPEANDDSFTVNEDSDANVLDVLGNDTGQGNVPPAAPNAGLSVTAVTQPAAGTGAVVNNGTSVSYTPPANFNGTATFSYTISDGSGGTASATVTVTVAPVNDNPIAVGDFATTTTGTPVVVNVLANDRDVENVPPAAPNEGLTVTAVTTPTNGTASINLGGSSLTYVSNAGFTGVDTFSYTVSDGNGGTATGSVAINVTGGDGGLVDIDIDRLTAGNRVAVGGTVTPNLRVRNNGVINQAVPATLVGVQGGQTVYVQTIQVSDAPGDVDVDQATATTRVR